MTHRIDLNKIIDLNYPVAEIGCAEGLFSLDILKWGVNLYMVDNWRTIPGQKGDGGYTQEWHDKNYMEAMERIKPYSSKVVVLRGLSVEMSKLVADNSLGLVYVDCDHSYKGVKADIEAWYPKLIKGGVMAFHDYENQNYGVKPAVKEFCKKHNLRINLLPENKISDAGAWFRK